MCCASPRSEHGGRWKGLAQQAKARRVAPNLHAWTTDRVAKPGGMGAPVDERAINGLVLHVIRRARVDEHLCAERK